MSLIRLTILLVLLGGLILVFIQNLSPVLPLVFLGMRTHPLPLAFWVLISTATGALTSVLMNNLAKLANNSGKRPQAAENTQSQSRTTSREVPPPRIQHQLLAHQLIHLDMTQLMIGEIVVIWMIGMK